MIRFLDDRRERLDVVRHIWAHPHWYTQEDIEWCKSVFACSEEEMQETFLNAAKFAVVEKDALPLYVMAVADTGQLHTLSEERLEGNAIYMTKVMKRYERTPEGAAFLDGVIGVADKKDLIDGKLPAWVKGFGFEPYAEVPIPGHNVIVYFHRVRT